MSTRKCEKCGAENPINSEFCAECGVKLPENPNNEGTNPISKWVSNWNKKSNSYKIITGLLGCCVGAFIIIMIFAAIFPTTALSLDNSTINIDNQTTEYLLKGKTEAGATVKISSKTLNIDNVEVKPSSDGVFEYKLQIPTNINESQVDVTAKVPKKSQNQQTATIKRPTSQPTTTQNNKFENKFISFTKPEGLTITDNSTDNKLDVNLYSGNNWIGEIMSATSTSKNIEGMMSLGFNTTIAGKNATQYSDSSAIGAYIYLGNNPNGEPMIINIDFDQEFSSAYNLIKDSLIIKQIPTA